MNFISDFDKSVLPTYTRFPVVFVKGKGMNVWDEEGNEFLSMPANKELCLAVDLKGRRIILFPLHL